MYYQNERTGHILTQQQAIDSGDKCSRIDKPIEPKVKPSYQEEFQNRKKMSKTALKNFILENIGMSCAQVSKRTGWSYDTCRAKMIHLGLDYCPTLKRWVDTRTNQTAINTYKVMEGLK